MEEVTMVISGAGSAAIACANLYVSFGVKPENVVMFNSKGALRKDDPKISDMQRVYATDKHFDDLAHAMKGADVFVGLSTGDIVTPDMLLGMADNPIVFAMANPTPEINYDLAIATRKDIIMATGRSDHPNQVNNVLGFPFIFRGALDVRATKINEDMKKAAVVALANLAKASVPEQVNIAYGETKLTFGRDYIIPKPFDRRVFVWISAAVAEAAIKDGVAKIKDFDIEAYKVKLQAIIDAELK